MNPSPEASRGSALPGKAEPDMPLKLAPGRKLTALAERSETLWAQVMRKWRGHVTTGPESVKKADLREADDSSG